MEGLGVEPEPDRTIALPPAEIRSLGLDELIDGSGVTAIEWAEKAEPLLPARAVRVRIGGAGDEPRTVEIDGAPPGWISSLPDPA